MTKSIHSINQFKVLKCKTNNLLLYMFAHGKENIQRTNNLTLILQNIHICKKKKINTWKHLVQNQYFTKQFIHSLSLSHATPPPPLCVCMSAQTHMHTHTHTHTQSTHTHTQTHRQTHTHTHTCTHICSNFPLNKVAIFVHNNHLLTFIQHRKFTYTHCNMQTDKTF